MGYEPLVFGAKPSEKFVCRYESSLHDVRLFLQMLLIRHGSYVLLVQFTQNILYFRNFFIEIIQVFLRLMTEISVFRRGGAERRLRGKGGLTLFNSPSSASTFSFLGRTSLKTAQ